VDGRLVSPEDAPADAPGEARACYTTARWTGRGLRFEDRHVARLVRDAATLGVGAVDADAVRRAGHELGRAVFGEDEGVVRIQASPGAGGAARLVATARALGAEPDRWRAITLDLPHPGAAPGGAKISRRRVWAAVADPVERAGVDEGLLFDDEDRLVEGTRTNLVAVSRDGAAFVPPAERGAVAGLALAIVCDALPELARRDLPRGALAGVRELVALNAVRGACPIVELDGRAVGDGRPGPWAARLAAALDAAA